MKRFLIITAMILGAAAFGSCVKEDISGPSVSQDGRRQISLQFSEAEEVETYSVASTNERTISDVYVAVFDGTSGKYKDSERIPTKDIDSYVTGNGTQTPTINTVADMAEGDKVVVLINANLPRNPRFDSGHTVDDINTVVPSTQWKFSQNGNNSGKGMPMSGEVVWSNSAPPVCRMYRSVAKIQVALDADLASKDVTGKFTSAVDAVQWAICNAPAKGNIYSVGGAMSIPAVTDTDFYSENTVVGNEYPHRVMTMPGAAAFQLNGYLPEYNSSVKAKTEDVGASVFAANRTCLLLKVPGAGISGGDGYYRLDLVQGNKADETKAYLDIRRNCHYTINISRVSSKGYDTAAEALAAPSSNVEYEISDMANHIFGNGQYAVVVDKNPVEVFSDMSTPQNLVRVGLRGNFPAGALCKVSLVQGKTSTLVSPSVIQLCTADGAMIGINKFEQVLTGDYQFMYTSRTSLPDDMFLRVSCGNILYYVPVQIGALTLELSAEEVEIGYQGGQTAPVTIHTNDPNGWTANIYDGYENMLSAITPPHGISGGTASAAVNLWDNVTGEFRTSRIRISTANGAVSKFLTVKQTVYPDVQIRGALEMAPIPVGIFPNDFGDYALRLNFEPVENLYMIVYYRNVFYGDLNPNPTWQGEYWNKMAGWNAETLEWDLLDDSTNRVAYAPDGYAYFGQRAMSSSWSTHYSNGNWIMVRYYLSKSDWLSDRESSALTKEHMRGKGFQSSLVNTMYDSGYSFPNYPPRL